VVRSVTVKSEVLMKLLELARRSTGASVAELVAPDDLAQPLFCSDQPDLEVMNDDCSSLGLSLHVADATDDARCLGWVGSFAALPVTGPSGGGGWLAVASADPEGLAADALWSLERIAELVEDHLDRAFEQERLDQLGEVLVSSQAHLQRVRNRLEASNDELEQFAYIAAHELVAPLRAVAVYAEVLERYVDDKATVSADQARACASEIRSGVGLMSQQVQYLMELSRTQTDAAQPEPVDLAGVVLEAVDNLAEPIAEVDAKIEVRALPVVAGRAVPLQSVFSNLISNALRYREPERTLVVTIDSEDLPEGPLVRVTDNGIGVDNDECRRIFQLFERSPDATHVPGSGIGLSLSRRIVEAFGASIGVDKADPVGSVFWIQFPPVSAVSSGLEEALSQAEEDFVDAGAGLG
jgi:signal transduction histidine kinase